MNIKKALFLGVISLVFLSAAFAHAATNDSRYFVKSTSQIWKKSFAARNVFDGGFTADLSDWQLRLAKVFGVSVQPIKKLNILATATATPSVSPTATPSPAEKSVKSKTPADSIPWGVKYIYGGKFADVPSGGNGINVAILDTGVAIDHPDLADRVAACADFSTSSKFIDGSCDDSNGHGTHVAGIVAADGGPDGSGIYGVAPSANLFVYKVCGLDGTCFADDVAAAIRYAVDQKANIILISVGTDTDILIINDAINYATAHDVMVIAAAGNDGPDSNGIDSPASNKSVVSVGALDTDGSIPDWSSRGNNNTSKAYIKEAGDIEFAAPGVNVESTWSDGGYAVLSGTSMAAAHVAGLVAKEWQTDATHPVQATLDILHKFSHDILPIGDDSMSGWGVPRL